MDKDVKIVLYEKYMEHGKEVRRTALGAIDAKEISDKEMIKKLYELCVAYNKELRINDPNIKFEFVEMTNLQWEIMQANALLQANKTLDEVSLLNVYENFNNEYNDLLQFNKNYECEDYEI